MKTDSTETYLRKYSPDLRPVKGSRGKYKYVVVVPCIAEYDNIIRFLQSFREQDHRCFRDTLLLFVVNNHPDSPAEVKEDNRKTIGLLDGAVNKAPGVPSPLPDIAYIDASTPGNELPEKEAGVGLARKTGMDASLRLLDKRERGLIICTDADCTFSGNYLTGIVRSFNSDKFDAAVVKFLHNTDDEKTADAVICYEIFLRYYVLGLKSSCSPFAFHTIGSAMACSRDAYIKVEGMNKRKAAEDFYFLEKLAKNFPVAKIKGTAVYPSPRSSWRVPFGTGQRVSRFLAGGYNEYVLYHPLCFEVLKEWHECFFNNDILSGKEYLNSAGKISRSLYMFLEEQGFLKAWNNISQNVRNEKNIMKQKIRWFDGFRTLKLVHYLRDQDLGSMRMFEALDALFAGISPEAKFSRKTFVPGRDVQLRYLEHLRKLDD